MRAIIVGLAVVLMAAAAQVRAGTVQPYWLTAGDQSKIYVVLGSTIVNTITTPAAPDHEYPIAVSDTIRTYAGIGTWFGREYLPDGTLTGNTYTNPGDFYGTWDGTTDAASYNYALQQGTGKVVRYDRNWANASVLFTAGFAGDFDWGGITFDSSNDTLWVNRRGSDPQFRNYALDGTLLSSFTLTGLYGNWGLAYEESTDTLWSLGTFGIDSREILNISKTGSVLESIFVPGLTGNILGGEMPIQGPSAVPEPSSLALFGFAVLGIAVCAARSGRQRACPRPS
jgi:hypothetical protein